MTGQTAIKHDLNDEIGNDNLLDAPRRDAEAQGDDLNVYDDELHRRFMDWKDQTGSSLQKIARMLNRSTAAVSQYVNRKFAGKLELMERDVANLLDREEDLQYAAAFPDKFCNTNASRQMWEILQYCDNKQKMGVVLAPSGTGKTETCKEYKRKNRATVFVAADITTRRLGSVLNLLASHIGGTRQRSISETLHYIVSRMKDSRRLIIIDDAHFLSWEAYEAVRKIHDCGNVGIVYVGQERLYDQMRGAESKSYLFDQIYSRIAIKRDKFNVVKRDAEAIARSLCANLDGACIDYLFNRAKGKGRFRSMSNILDVAIEAANTNHVPVSVDLLRDAATFLKTE